MLWQLLGQPEAHLQAVADEAAAAVAQELASDADPAPAVSAVATVDPDAPAPAPSVSTEKIASEISDNLEKLIGSEPETKTVSTPAPAKPAARPMHPESATIKFEDLKFGRNYDPTSSK